MRFHNSYYYFAPTSTPLVRRDSQGGTGSDSILTPLGIFFIVIISTTILAAILRYGKRALKGRQLKAKGPGTFLRSGSLRNTQRPQKPKAWTQDIEIGTTISPFDDQQSTTSWAPSKPESSHTRQWNRPGYSESVRTGSVNYQTHSAFWGDDGSEPAPRNGMSTPSEYYGSSKDGLSR